MVGGDWRRALRFEPDVDIATVRSDLAESMWIESVRVDMFFGAKKLEDGRTLSSYDIENDAFIAFRVAPWTDVEFKNQEDLDESEKEVLDRSDPAGSGRIMCVRGCGKTVAAYYDSSVFCASVVCACEGRVFVCRSPAGILDVSHTNEDDALVMETLDDEIYKLRMLWLQESEQAEQKAEKGADKKYKKAAKKIYKAKKAAEKSEVSKDVKKTGKDKKLFEKDVEKDSKDVKKAGKDKKLFEKDVKKDVKDKKFFEKDVKKDSKDVKKTSKDVKKTSKDVKKTSKDVKKNSKDVKKAGKDKKLFEKDVKKNSKDKLFQKDAKKNSKDVKKAGKDKKLFQKDAKKKVESA